MDRESVHSDGGVQLDACRSKGKRASCEGKRGGRQMFSIRGMSSIAVEMVRKSLL